MWIVIEVSSFGVSKENSEKHSLCNYGNEIHDFGYAPATRVVHVIVQRLQATRLCLFGLLAVSGLCLDEPLNLQYRDIDWAEGMLTLLKTKFGKSRLVPLHAFKSRF
jgi:integrase